MQTKYSAVIYAALVLAHAVIYRRPREAAVALGAAAALFLGWEALLFARYGQSHLLAGLERQIGARHPARARASRHAGARERGASTGRSACSRCSAARRSSPACSRALGLGASRRAVASAGLAAGVAFAAIPLLPRPPVFAAEGFFTRLAAFNPELFLFVPLGLCTAGVIGAVALAPAAAGRSSRPAAGSHAGDLARARDRQLLRDHAVSRRAPRDRTRDRRHPARRACGLTARGRTRSPACRLAAAFGLALGALYFGADLADARARRDLVARVVDRLPQLGAHPERETVWYNGHWELQYYAEQAGMRPVIAGRSQLRPQDWLILSEGTNQPPLSFPAESLPPAGRAGRGEPLALVDDPALLRRARPLAPPARDPDARTDLSRDARLGVAGSGLAALTNPKLRGEKGAEAGAGERRLRTRACNRACGSRSMRA